MSTATHHAGHTAGAEIIPFPGRALRAARLARAESNPWTVRQQPVAPVIEWGGSHYHEAAIAEAALKPRA